MYIAKYLMKKKEKKKKTKKKKNQEKFWVNNETTTDICRPSHTTGVDTQNLNSQSAGEKIKGWSMNDNYNAGDIYAKNSNGCDQ